MPAPQSSNDAKDSYPCQNTCDSVTEESEESEIADAAKEGEPSLASDSE